ncbi:hypothetical protein [Deinococcus ficus]|uniref:hypothetical protein n=1 Tax=Deinococcus ficus TaxID=317577 RepID=UPI00174A8EE4|nr:hypothetical protein [Deinococcus ficus]GHF77095.1 hypothetical protein GCM10017782_14000 [Deinococcus ficus]
MPARFRAALPCLLILATPVTSAQPGPAPTPRWTDLLQPPAEVRQKACDDLAAFEKANPSPAGQKYTSAALPAEQTIGQQLADRRRSPGVPERVVNNILIQLPAANVGSICANAARENRTVNVRTLLMTTTFYVQTDVAMVRDALKFSATLRYLDETGKVLAEAQPTRLTRTADPAQWDRKCVQGECRWHGFSLFNFSGPGNTAQLYAKLHTLQLVYDRGYGTETRTYVAADFTRTELKD